DTVPGRVARVDFRLLVLVVGALAFLADLALPASERRHLGRDVGGRGPVRERRARENDRLGVAGRRRRIEGLRSLWLRLAGRERGRGASNEQAGGERDEETPMLHEI